MESLKVSPKLISQVLKAPAMKLQDMRPLSSMSINSMTTSPNNSTSMSIDKPDNNDLVGFRPELAKGMELEEERLKTFDKWPVSYLSPEQLAKNGFYYLGRGDEVRCAFCRVEIMRWVESDDPAEEHKRWAPQCPLIRRNITGGSMFNASTSNGEVVDQDECGARVPTTSGSRMPGPVHPTYASEAARLSSFKDWPRCMRQKPEELAEAGFFYTGNGDKTKCFYCDGGLKDWENDDVPWEQHARWFDRCAYVQLVKGREYVEKVLAEAGAAAATKTEKAVPNVPATATTDNGEQEKEVDDEKMCKICYIEERNVCFVPCGHVVACAKCALSTDKCPMCRRTFQSAVRLYFS